MTGVSRHLIRNGLKQDASYYFVRRANSIQTHSI